jgi:tetratricopeptide (TPR) repeat protein
VAPAALRHYTPRLPAYEAYLKARHHLAKVNPESLARSREYYDEAIALDAGFALAHIGLAEHYLLLTFSTSLLPAHEAMPLVRACARKALELDPSLPEARGMLGVVAAVYDYDWKDAQRLFRLAMAHEPVSPPVREYYGYLYLLPMGRPEDAVEELRKALTEDPLNLMFRLLLGDSLMAAGRYEDSSAEYHRILEFDKNYWWAYVMLAWNHALRGALAEAGPLAERAYSMMPWNLTAAAVFAAVLQRSGDTTRAEKMLRTTRNSPGQYGAPRALATFYFLCGEMDLAAEWAGKSVEQRDPGIPALSAFALFRSSSCWPALAKAMNLV